MKTGDTAVRIEIRFKAHRCLRARSTWSDCSTCRQSCPSGAIKLAPNPKPGDPPLFDPKRCMHCGTCLSSCQHDAFVAEYFSERKATRRIAEQNPDVIRCFLPYGELSALSSNARCYQISTCLASLTPGTLFEIAFMRPRLLATGKCLKCRLGSAVVRQIAANIETARLLLAEWGKQDNLLVTDPLAPFANIPSKDPSLIDFADEPQRETPRAKRIFGRIAKAQTAPSTSTIDLPAIHQHESSWRKAIAQYWLSAKPGQISGTEYPWPEHFVDAYACVGCGMCAQMCPSASIRHVLENGEFSYRFTPGTCIECGLCAAICSQNAIMKDAYPQISPFEEMICFDRNAQACPRCKGPIFEGEEIQGVCPTCANELGLERNF